MPSSDSAFGSARGDGSESESDAFASDSSDRFRATISADARRGMTSREGRGESWLSSLASRKTSKFGFASEKRRPSRLPRRGMSTGLRPPLRASDVGGSTMGGSFPLKEPRSPALKEPRGGPYIMRTKDRSP